MALFRVSLLYRNKKTLMLICAFISMLLLLISNSEPNYSNIHGNDISPEGLLYRLVGLDDVSLAARLRQQRINNTVQRYGSERCGLHHLGVSEIVDKQGCMGPLCKELTCSNLLFGAGNELYYDFAVKWMNIHPFGLKPDADVGVSAANCSQFLAAGGYRMSPPTQLEGSTVIAFNILLHRDLEQVEHLLRAIYRPHNVYCVHVDAKIPEDIQNAMQSVVNCLPNVYMVTNQVRVVYAGYSRLQADINCMQDQLAHPVKWDYLINLAGQAYPLRTNEEIAQILRIYNGANDIEGVYGPRVIRNRFEKVWEETGIDGNLPKLQHNGEWKEPPPYNLDIIKGNVYGVFSRRFVEWIMVDKKAQALLEWSKNTWSPDEHYWATLHHTFTNPQLNPPGGYAENPNSKPWLAAYVSWFYGGEPCHGKYVHGVCIFGVRDLPILVDRKELFVNKFYLDYQPLGLACLEKYINYKWQCPQDFDHEYYESLPFIIKRNNTLEGPAR